MTNASAVRSSFVIRHSSFVIRHSSFAGTPHFTPDKALGYFPIVPGRFTDSGRGIRPMALARGKAHVAGMNSIPPLVARENRTCNIVTFYEDFASAVHAYAAFDWLSRNVGNNLPVKPTSSSFAVLAVSPPLLSVLQESAPADVLVVSAHGDKDLPPHIAAWVEDCLSREPDAKPVLVALLDDEL